MEQAKTIGEQAKTIARLQEEKWLINAQDFIAEQNPAGER